MKRIIIILLFSFASNLQAFDAHTVGNGGDPYTDEFKAIRENVLTIWRQQKQQYKTIFDVDGEKFEALLGRAKSIAVLRDDKLSVQSRLGVAIDLLADLRKKDSADLLTINGEKKAAVNYALDDLDVIIFAVGDWAKLDQDYLRKTRLVAHEILGILGYEKTGDTHISGTLTLKDLQLNPILTKNDIPVVPLWRAPFSYDFAIENDTSCRTEANENKIHQAMLETCRKQAPAGKPTPFFRYECSVVGKLVTYTNTYMTTHTYHTKAHVPETKRIHESHSQTYYYRTDPYVSYYLRTSDEKTTVLRPAFTIDQTQTHEVPVTRSHCHAEGTLALIGIDPILDEGQVKKIATSEGSFDEAVWAIREDAYERAVDQCFANRKKLPRGLVNHSRCEMEQLDEKSWRWNLWGVCPYRSECIDTLQNI